MFSFKSILVAAAAFASFVSAVPTPEAGNSLNIAQRSPGGLPIIGDLHGGVERLPIGGNAPVKRGGSSCKEIIQKCHDKIALITDEIS